MTTNNTCKPEDLTILQLKRWLTEHNVSLPGTSLGKQGYVDLVKHYVKTQCQELHRKENIRQERDHGEELDELCLAAKSPRKRRLDVKADSIIDAFDHQPRPRSILRPTLKTHLMDNSLPQEGEAKDNGTKHPVRRPRAPSYPPPPREPPPSTLINPPHPSFPPPHSSSSSTLSTWLLVSVIMCLFSILISLLVYSP